MVDCYIYCSIHAKIDSLIQNTHLNYASSLTILSINAEFNLEFNSGPIVSVFPLATAGSDAAIIASILR